MGDTARALMRDLRRLHDQWEELGEGMEKYREKLKAADLAGEEGEGGAKGKAKEKADSGFEW